jgi:hypothetical protein
MARPKNATPIYRKSRNSARCWVDGKWVMLGKWNSPESKAEFACIIAERKTGPLPARNTSTVVQLLAAYWLHAEKHYRYPDGTPTSEQKEIALSLAPRPTVRKE